MSLKIRILLFTIGGILGLGLVGAGALFGYEKWYENKIYPGVYVGDYHLGGLSSEQARNLVENYNNRLAREGLNFLVIKINGERVSFKLNNISDGDGNAAELVKVEGERLVREAMIIGRDGNRWQNLWRPWLYRFTNDRIITAPILFDEVGFRTALKNNLSSLETGARNANIVIKSWSELDYDVLPEQAGGIFVYDKIIPSVKNSISQMSFESMVISQDRFQPTINVDDVIKAAENLSEVFSYGSLNLNYVNPQTQIRRDWKIDLKEYINWLEVTRDQDNNLIFSLNEEKVKKYLDILRTDVDEEARDAKFVMENERVKEFQASRPGIRLNLDQTYKDIDKAFEERSYRSSQVTKTVTLAVDIVEPQMKMGDANSLGISEVVGSGYSTFYDSHTNRIKNIANAVKRLNGTLIKPGEIFSANNYAGPFTLANGYLPEAVIKGTEIKDEVGGGMCQIGTTLFRMAMNSGMDIVERHNHSLVVSYYADPVNHNPGTDAALYEPMLDLKFLNDTGNYLLLQTEIDYEKKQLTFTLWGKSDGRKGWYTHPLVSRWIPAGEQQNILVSQDPKVKPGTTKCQVAYRGAVASFTYSRVTPTGEKIDRVFESYYRPLPKICLVGVETIPEGCKERAVCTVDPATTDDGVATSSAIIAPAE